MQTEAAYDLAKHRAKYAHRDGLVLVTPQGAQTADLSRDTLKAALLSVGTAGRFALVGAVSTSRIGWRQGVRMLRSFAKQEA